ncbi:MAG: hypothetical protein ACFCU6_00015, partial [Balneolaceae bacterium]
IIYSPGIYTGNLYLINKITENKWKKSDIFSGVGPQNMSVETFNSESKFLSNKKYPAVLDVHFGPGVHWGRVYSIDAGIYQLNDGRIVHFFGEWRGGDTSLEEGNLLEIDVQVFDENLELTYHQHLFKVAVESRPKIPLVNWKDDDDNFYLLDVKNGIPSVRRFRLDIPG